MKTARQSMRFTSWAYRLAMILAAPAWAAESRPSPAVPQAGARLPRIAVDAPGGHGARLQARHRGEGLEIDIFSDRGIGAAVLYRPVSGWPETLVLRLHLRGLEQLTIAAGEARLNMAVSSHPPYGSRCRRRDRASANEKDVPAGSPWHPRVRLVTPRHPDAPRIPLEHGYIDVVLPAVWLARQPPEFRIRWIDFYRQ